MRITGTMIGYLFVCDRKLWLFYRHIEMEHTSGFVALGKLLHEETFAREKKKEVLIDGQVRIDFIDNLLSTGISQFRFFDCKTG